MTTKISRAISLGVFVGLLSLLHPAMAASPCSGVDTQLTKQRKADFAKLIAQNIHKKVKSSQKVKPSQVEIDNFMQSGKWTVVFASVPIAEPGYFFFDSTSGTQEFKDVWGGVAEKNEIPEVTKWALRLGADKAIASCFANAATY